MSKKQRKSKNVKTVNDVINNVNAIPVTATETKKMPFTVETRVSAVFIKIYAEQCGYVPYNNIMTSANSNDIPLQISFIRNVLNSIVTDVNFPYDCYAIIHDKDTYCDKDIFDSNNEVNIFCSPAIEKPHAHLVIVTRGSENNGQGKTRPKRTTIGAILNALLLHGLNFRIRSSNPDVAASDLNLLKNQGLIKLKMQDKQHIRTIVYLTHETIEARETDGKYQYDRKSVYTNNLAFFDYAHEYYSNMLSVKNSIFDIRDYQIKFLELGKQLGDFMTLWNDLPYALQTPANRKHFEMHYNDGLNSIVDNIPPFPRCCIFLHGVHNVGKTYNTKKAFEMLGIKAYEAPSIGTGKYDDLKLTHKAFIANDTTSLPDIWGLCDNKSVRLHRRNKNNPIFLGNYVVITSNLSLDEWCKRGYEQNFEQTQIDAIKSRLIDVYVDSNRQTHTTLSQLRGDIYNIAEVLKLFNAFLTAFNQSISSYVPMVNQNISMQSLASQILSPNVLSGVTFK